MLLICSFFHNLILLGRSFIKIKKSITLAIEEYYRKHEEKCDLLRYYTLINIVLKAIYYNPIFYTETAIGGLLYPIWNVPLQINITSTIEEYTIGNTRCKYYTLINIVLKAIYYMPNFANTNLVKYLNHGILITLKSDVAVRPNNVYLAAIYWNHLANIIHARIGIDVKGDPLWVEA